MSHYEFFIGNEKRLLKFRVTFSYLEAVLSIAVSQRQISDWAVQYCKKTSLNILFRMKHSELLLQYSFFFFFLIDESFCHAFKVEALFQSI